jgi:hypothetical protein
MTLSQEIRIAMLAVAQGRPIPAPRPLLIEESDVEEPNPRRLWMQKEIATAIADIKSRTAMCEANMNHEELAKTVGEMKATAVMFVRRHAAISAPDVSAAMVDSICQALGDISIDEATAALDRLQAEAITTG